MPIEGLTTKISSFPCLGTIRKGAPQGKKTITDEKTGELREVPVIGGDLDYFRFVGSLPSYTEQFIQLFGKEPRQLKCWLPYPDVDGNLEAWMEEYSTAQLRRRCDRVQQCLWSDNQGRYHQTPKPCAAPSCKCKPTARLKIILPEFLKVGLVGYVLVTSTSKNDVMELSANLSAAYALNRNLVGIKFLLQRVPRTVSVPTGNGRSRVEKYLLNISPDPEWVTQQMSIREIEQGQRPSLLPPAAEIVEDDDEDDVIDLLPAQATDYHQSKAWQTMTSLFFNAKTPEQIEQARQWAENRIACGELPIAARVGIDREIQIAREKLVNCIDVTAVPTQPSTPAPVQPANSSNPLPETPNRKRMQAVASWTGHKNKQIVAICKGLDYPTNADELTDEQLLSLRDALFIDWGQGQNAFSHINHAKNSYTKMLRDLNAADDEQVWSAWQAKVAEKLILLEPVTDQDAEMIEYLRSQSA